MADTILTHCEVPLTRGLVALVDAADIEHVSRWKWRAVKAKRSGGGFMWYAIHTGPRPARALVSMHRLLLGLPDDILVDHGNGNGLDNRRRNIRPATDRQNAQNRQRVKSGKSSRFLGVYWHKHRGRWMARIRAGKISETTGHSKPICLGYFEDEESAARVRDAAARKYFGAFASFNFPEEVSHA